MEEKKETRWYLPHFPVVDLDRATTKVRIVFDGSVKNEGLSLNDTIHQGPKLQNDIFNVLLRFRRNKIAIVCDIKEMYLRISIPEEDRKFFRFFWRNMEVERHPRLYEFTCVVFGISSSPFQAQFVSRYNADKYDSELKSAADTVRNSCYIDDCLDSANTEEEAIQLYHELIELWQRANMEAKKWLSNSHKVLENIPKENRAKEVDLDSELPTTKALGISWNAERDSFKFKVTKPDYEVKTKRSFLKLVSTIFDPHGFVAPVILNAKILIQELWKAKLDWDEKITGDLINKINAWHGDLELIEDVEVNRWFRMGSEDERKNQIHIFTDASEWGYAAVAYSKSEKVDGTKNLELIACKTKVAPLTAMSTPRLELLAAELGVKLAEKVCESLEVEIKGVKMWTDSRDVIGWLSNRSRVFKPFVSFRVGKIQNITDIEQWSYIESKKNPADKASRGQSMSEFLRNQDWFKGQDTSFLEEAEERDLEMRQGVLGKPLLEMRKNIFFGYKQEIQFCDDPRLEVNRFSNLTRLLRVRSWVTRFIHNCVNSEKKVGELSQEEIESTFLSLVKMSQLKRFSDEVTALKQNRQVEKKSSISALNPFLDLDEILRSNSRIQYAEILNFDTKFPIILPKKDKITELIIKDQHEKEHHVGGTNTTLSNLSAKFWINGARDEIRQWELKCNTCKRKKAKVTQQIMGNLPKFRVGASLRPFTKVGVDYAGPFLTKSGRGRVRNKRWLCLFTCLEIRAVHLEVAFGLDTSSFLNCLWRFTNRRGLPELIISDNGSNFVKADKELSLLVKNLDTEDIKAKTSHKGISWKFNPPCAPHFGGVFEIMIKAAKKSIYAQLHQAEVTDEELITILTSAEHLINSRPLTYQSANQNDIIPLTPNHFIYGMVGDNMAPEIDSTSKTLLSRWKRVQEVIKNFWTRWMKEWLPGLIPRKKWRVESKNVQIGDIVLVVDPDTPRGKWPLGRIIKTFPSTDGNIRKVQVIINRKKYIRPISRICILKLD